MDLSFKSGWVITAVILSLCISMCHAQECNANDRNALLEFKAGFITYDFFFESWKSGSNCCQWNGVNCTSSGRVQGLRITNPFARNGPSPVGERNTSYTGVVGATLGDLTELRTLELSMILFNGPMPDTFNKLKKLEELSVAFNNFSGSLSPSIGGVTSLKSLIAVGSNYLLFNPGLLPAPIPSSFCGLRNLETLSLSSFLLTGKLPECFCKFSQITDLLLAENRLEGVVPSCIGSSLGKLVSLDLSSNQFVGPFPTTLSRLTSLQTLSLYQNKFTGSIPSVIGNMGSLQVLILADNSFSGAIPPSIANLAELGTLDLSVNLFTRVPPEIGQLTKLNYLSLSNNKLQGKLLPEIGKCGSQGFGLFIDVGYNKLSGSIPDVFASGNISFFSGSNNLFTGGFPLSLTMVGNVDLSHNSLSDVNSVGTLPLAPKLSVLNLANNVLSGPVPSWLTNIVAKGQDINTGVDTVDISVNKLTGPIPAILLEKLFSFNASYNWLSGQLPLVSGSRLGLLDLSHNRISGPITSNFVGSLLNTTFQLDLSFNQLSGPLPANSGDFLGLSYLDLSYNKLTGKVPASIENITSLSYLDLSHNKFTGRVPSKKPPPP